MLDELSFASNRGSRLFKQRQRRSEKYTFESIQNQNNKQQIPDTVVSQIENGNDTDHQTADNNLEATQTPDITVVPNPDSIAPALPGYGGPLKDIPPEKFNSTAVPKSYHSPWEQAISNSPGLADTLATCMSVPEPKAEIPGYKSFNRVATPFGGFSRGPKPALIKPLTVEPLPDCPELQADTPIDRPSFNRAALGWVSAGNPVSLPTASVEPVLIPESDDL
ncbi:myozenin-2a [Notolabrus celidotus]|uniref:myozenin-2a n=1 Tax=Notolabrus celidotus TaxID=1203425 RepID=UPI00148FB728|nr:myozenin-2a [Notolabrus celidotus]